MSYIPIDELKVYQIAMEIGEEEWTTVEKWDKFQKETIGQQFCEAADSIAANISEGHGRFHFKENKNFCFYARGSLLETKTWLRKSHHRKLIEESAFSHLSNLLLRCHQMLNKYIKSIGTMTPTKNELREPNTPYGPGQEVTDLPF